MFAFTGLRRPRYQAANGKSDNFSRLDAATGRLIAADSAGPEPFGLVCDGRHAWVVNQGSANVKRL